MDFNRTYRINDGKQINRVFIISFVYNFYYLTPIKIYQGDMIDCWESVDMENFKQKIHSGKIVPHPPEGSEAACPNRSVFKAHNVQCNMDPKNFIGEAADRIKAFNGRPTSSYR